MGLEQDPQCGLSAARSTSTSFSFPQNAQRTVTCPLVFFVAISPLFEGVHPVARNMA
jgi:hypothetical protein